MAEENKVLTGDDVMNRIESRLKERGLLSFLTMGGKGFTEEGMLVGAYYMSNVKKAVLSVINPLLDDVRSRLCWKIDVSFPEGVGPKIDIEIIGPKWFNDMVRPGCPEVVEEREI